MDRFWEDGFVAEDVGDGVVGEVDPEEEPGQQCVHEARPVDDDGGDLLEGELEGDGATGGDGKSATAHEGIGRAAEVEVDGEVALLDRSADGRFEFGFGDGEGELEVGVEELEFARHFKLDFEVVADLGGPASGEDADEVFGLLLFDRALHGGVADEEGGESSPFEVGGLEGEEGEEEVEASCHFGDSLRPPRPDGGADVLDDLAFVAGFAQLGSEAEVESGVVDEDNRFGGSLHDRLAQGAQLAEDGGEAAEGADEPHDLKRLHGEEGGDSSCAHSWAGDPPERGSIASFLELFDQL